MKRIISLVLAASMVFAALTGCSNNTKQDSNSTTSTKNESGKKIEELSYPLKGNITLSYSAPEAGNVTAVSKWEETPFVKAWQEQSGVKLKISHPADFSLLLASGDYPDIIVNNWNSYSGGVAKAIEDGIIVPINKYIETCAPDYLKELKSNKEWEKSTKTQKGDIGGFYNLRSEGALNSNGIIIRRDWLNKVNMSVPTTLDEFYNVLVAFKEKMGAATPLSITLSYLRTLGSNGLITSAFGLPSTGYYHVNGKVHYGAYEKQYKDMLHWLNKLYKEGLLDNNVLTVDDKTVNANIMNGKSGVMAGTASGVMGAIMTSMEKVNPEFTLAGVGSLVKNKNDKAMFNQRTDAATNPSVITSNCKNIEAAVKFLNYGYTKEGSRLMYYGVEGKSYELKNDYPYYTDFVKKNPNGLPFAQAISQYSFSPQLGPYISNGDYSLQTYNQAQLDALKAWRNSDVNNYYIPSLAIGKDSAEEYATITSEINTYVNEQFVLFVTGARSLNEFDDYIKTLQSLKIDRMLKIYQDTFDIYNK